MKNDRHSHFDHHTSENNWHNPNLSEGVINEFIIKWYHVMVRNCVPGKQCYDDYRWVASTMALTCFLENG